MRTASFLRPLALVFPLALVACAAAPDDVADDPASALEVSDDPAADPDGVADDVLADDATGEVAALDDDGASSGEEATGTSVQAAKVRCGARIETKCSGGKNPGCYNYLYYRHCTSGSGSIKVKAVISLWPDSPCTKVGPNREVLLSVYPALTSSFKGIKRC